MPEPWAKAQARPFIPFCPCPCCAGTRAIGAILLRRTEVRPFNDKQINLLSTFADQAVIAIQNARLFNEIRKRRDLRARKTATADILKVIASSPDDVQPVFQAIAERSNHLVGGFATTVVSIVDDVVHLSAFTSTTPAADAALRAFYPRPLSGFTYSDAVRRGEIHRIVDAEVELAGQPDELAIVRRRGWRSALWVPLLLDGEAIGVIGVTRVEPGPFADHHVDMLKTFADQAVIAISNVNLFNRFRSGPATSSKSLQQQTATADVLQGDQPFGLRSASRSWRPCHQVRGRTVRCQPWRRFSCAMATCFRSGPRSTDHAGIPAILAANPVRMVRPRPGHRTA